MTLETMFLTPLLATPILAALAPILLNILKSWLIYEGITGVSRLAGRALQGSRENPTKPGSVRAIGDFLYGFSEPSLASKRLIDAAVGPPPDPYYHNVASVGHLAGFMAPAGIASKGRVLLGGSRAATAAANSADEMAWAALHNSGRLGPIAAKTLSHVAGVGGAPMLNIGGEIGATIAQDNLLGGSGAGGYAPTAMMPGYQFMASPELLRAAAETPPGLLPLVEPQGGVLNQRSLMEYE